MKIKSMRVHIRMEGEGDLYLNKEFKFCHRIEQHKEYEKSHYELIKKAIGYLTQLKEAGHVSMKGD